MRIRARTSGHRESRRGPNRGGYGEGCRKSHGRRAADFLVASQTPTVAISSDPTVNRVMADLGLTDYPLHIRDFTAEGVIEKLDTLMLCRKAVVEQTAAYRRGNFPGFAMQYDALAELAKARRQGRN